MWNFLLQDKNRASGFYAVDSHYTQYEKLPEKLSAQAKAAIAALCQTRVQCLHEETTILDKLPAALKTICFQYDTTLAIYASATGLATIPENLVRLREALASKKSH